MRIVGLFGDHPRHRYIARQVAETGSLAGIVVEERESHVPEPPDRLDDHLTELYEHHFQRRADAEERFFGGGSFPDVGSIRISQDELNNDRTREFLRKVNPDLGITYGVHILDDETIGAVPGDLWNVHGGLSPEYRGVITHFWPSYMLEPQMTGVTLHEITSEIDGGGIVHQTGGELVRGDGVHELACRTVESFGEELTSVLELAERAELDDPVPQESSGKLWLSRDWRPEHLIPVYETFDNEIVDHYLDGEFEHREPDLVRQL